MRSPWQLRIAALQMCARGELAANLAVCRARIAEAAAAGARVVVLPECFAFLGAGGPGAADKLAIAESFDGPEIGPIQALLVEAARAHGAWIVGGGVPERVPGDAARTYNTAVVFDPRGALVARYRKIHLFDVDIPGGATLKESDATAAGGGDDLVVIEVDGARIGITICYDLRFPELYRALAIDRGAEVLLVPAAFTAHTGAAHWEILLRARAIEDQAYVVAAAQWGQHNEKRASFGHSMIVDPWGVIVAQQAEGDGVVIATIDGAEVARRRTQMPCFAHVRTR